MPKSRTVTFGAVGDVAFARDTSREIQAHGPDWPFEKMKDVLKRADLLFGNMESVMVPDDFPTDHIDPVGMVTSVKGPEAAGALRRAGFDFLNLAANHVLDAGSIGLDHTRKCLEDAGIVAGGVGWTQDEARTLKVIEKSGIRFGFLCYAEDSNWTLGQTDPGFAFYHPDSIIEDIRAHRKEADILVVSIHGDMEFMPTPSVPRLEISRTLARAGADIILEHHPHVPQGIEMIGRRLVAYSLGNFVFNAHTSNYLRRNSPRCADSFVLFIEVDKSGVRSFERVPLRIQEPPEERPRPCRGKEREDMLAYLAQLDTLLNDEEFVRKTWRATARKRVWDLLQRAASRDVDNFVEETLGRLVFVPENRSCLDEVLAEAREHWEKARKSDPWHRPNFRFQKPS